jgi:hypothetical protein
MNKRTITITVDNDVAPILLDMEKRDINRSRHINSLLKYSASVNFEINKPAPAVSVFGDKEE